MNQEIKKLWVAALRSGKYKQGVGSLLNRVDEYCCLGVLCDLAVKKQVVHSFLDAHNGRNEVPGDIVRLWAGLTDSNPQIANSSLAQLNDQGATFTEIADIIEKEL